MTRSSGEVTERALALLERFVDAHERFAGSCEALVAIARRGLSKPKRSKRKSVKREPAPLPEGPRDDITRRKAVNALRRAGVHLAKDSNH